MMDFNTLLQHSEYSTNKEIVGLAIYYLEMFEELEWVSRTDVNDVIATSRESVPSKHISTYIKRLEGDGKLSDYEDGYVLSPSGLAYFKDCVDDSLIGESREDAFIETNFIDDPFYRQLAEDINECYRVKVNDAVLVLTRKLFENLIVDILRGHYGRENIDLFFDTNRGYHHGLSELKRNLRKNIKDFKIYSRDINKELVDSLDDFKEHGDAGAHSIVVGLDDAELEEMADEANQLTKVLYDILSSVRNANE